MRRVPWQIAIAQIAGTARYATLSVSAIIVSFSLMASMAIMVTSFRDSLDAWTQQLLPADLYVRVGYVGQSAHLDAATADACSRLPGRRARRSAAALREARLGDSGRTVTLIARSLDPRGSALRSWMSLEATATLRRRTRSRLDQ